MKVFLIIILFFHSLFLFSSNINDKKLDSLKKNAKETNSSYLAIYKNNKVVYEWYDEKPTKIDGYQITASVVSLAIGRLITLGYIESIDEKIWKFYPEWLQGRKKEISIRQILEGTSGLQYDVEESFGPDVVQYALAAELTSDPGSVVTYNNKALNLLAGIVERSTGKKLDIFVKEELFKPIGIIDVSWEFDYSKINPLVWTGLKISPMDLAKIGLLVVNNGILRKDTIIKPEWFKLSNNIFLWHRIPQKSYYVVDSNIIDKLISANSDSSYIHYVKKLIGKYDSFEVFNKKYTTVFTGNWKKEWNSKEYLINLGRIIEDEKTIGYMASSFVGQQLVVDIENNLVAVRAIKSINIKNERKDYFYDFYKYVIDLCR